MTEPHEPFDAPTGPPHVRIEMLSQPRYLSGARELVSAVARRFGFDDGACSQIALAVDEALCNVIRHAYQQQVDQPIWISIWPYDEEPASVVEDPPACDPHGIRIHIEDQGPHVDPGAIRGRDLDDVRPGGLGVYIIRQVMDHVAYEQRPEGGMRLVLAKQNTTASKA